VSLIAGTPRRGIGTVVQKSAPVSRLTCSSSVISSSSSSMFVVFMKFLRSCQGMSAEVSKRYENLNSGLVTGHIAQGIGDVL
jgi:hypothetical protein